MDIQYYTKALVLDRRLCGEQDAYIELFTEKLGRVIARARSVHARKSKLSGHLQPLHFIKIRITPRASGSGFVVIDSILDDAFVPSETRRRSDLSMFVKTVALYAPEMERDDQLWFLIQEVFSTPAQSSNILCAHAQLLSLVGFDPQHAVCGVCASHHVGGFVLSHGLLSCPSCLIPFPSHDVLYFTA